MWLKFAVAFFFSTVILVEAPPTKPEKIASFEGKKDDINDEIPSEHIIIDGESTQELGFRGKHDDRKEEEPLLVKPHRRQKAKHDDDILRPPDVGKDFCVTLRIKEKWYKELAFIHSAQFQSYRERIQSAILQVYASNDLYLDTFVLGFRNGSVLADIVIRFTRESDHPLDLLTKALATGQLGTLPVTETYEKVDLLDECRVPNICPASCTNPLSCFPSCDITCCSESYSSMTSPPVIDVDGAGPTFHSSSSVPIVVNHHHHDVHHDQAIPHKIVIEYQGNAPTQSLQEGGIHLADDVLHGVDLGFGHTRSHGRRGRGEHARNRADEGESENIIITHTQPDSSNQGQQYMAAAQANAYNQLLARWNSEFNQRNLGQYYMWPGNYYQEAGYMGNQFLPYYGPTLPMPYYPNDGYPFPGYNYPNLSPALQGPVYPYTGSAWQGPVYPYTGNTWQGPVYPYTGGAWQGQVYPDAGLQRQGWVAPTGQNDVWILPIDLGQDQGWANTNVGQDSKSFSNTNAARATQSFSDTNVARNAQVLTDQNLGREIQTWSKPIVNSEEKAWYYPSASNQAKSWNSVTDVGQEQAWSYPYVGQSWSSANTVGNTNNNWQVREDPTFATDTTNDLTALNAAMPIDNELMLEAARQESAFIARQGLYTRGSVTKNNPATEEVRTKCAGCAKFCLRTCDRRCCSLGRYAATVRKSTVPRYTPQVSPVQAVPAQSKQSAKISGYTTPELKRRPLKIRK